MKMRKNDGSERFRLLIFSYTESIISTHSHAIVDEKIDRPLIWRNEL